MEILMMQEELKSYPFGAVWDYFCEKNGVPAGMTWYDEVEQYEKQILEDRK